MEKNTNTWFAEAKDEVLISLVKDEQSNEAFLELRNRYENLFYKVCHNYMKILSQQGFDKNDIFEEVDAVLFDSINKYNPDKGCSFCSWVGNYTRYFCLNKINKKEIKIQEVAEEEFSDKFDKISMSRFSEEEKRIDFDSVFNILNSSGDDRLRYDADSMKKPSWDIIANQLNLSVQMTVDLHKKAIRILKTRIKYFDDDIFSKTI